MSRAHLAKRGAPPPESQMGRPLGTRWDEALRQAMAEPGEWFNVKVPSSNHSLSHRLKQIAARLGGHWEVTQRGCHKDAADGGEGTVYWRYIGPAVKP